ncbi:MAG: DedA family protein [Labilithrix sp.]|nr:DedA family protein [Labilithrix sp.]MCW5817026.1 DedA family protein [Labilithrix sp.]
MHELLAIFRSLTKNLDQFTIDHGNTTYAILFLIVFAETGLVVTPFLPGDSLLFAAGAVASRGYLNVVLLAAGLIAAAIVGDTLNYHVGKAIGPRVMKSEKSRLFNKKHLDKTHKFYEKYGPKTIVLARFVPIVRTFAPFVAGAGAMNYRKFIVYNVVGAVAWVTLMLGSGWMLGQVPFVKERFELIVIGIVILSVMPMVIEYIKARAEGKGAPEAVAEAATGTTPPETDKAESAS